MPKTSFYAIDFFLSSASEKEPCAHHRQKGQGQLCSSFTQRSLQPARRVAFALGGVRVLWAGLWNRAELVYDLSRQGGGGRKNQPRPCWFDRLCDCKRLPMAL